MSSKPATSSNGEKEKEAAKSKQTVAVFPDIENAEAPIQLSRETTHSNHHILIAPDNLTLRGTKGYCQAKCNNGVTEGRWYYEVDITKMGPKDNARIGWSMISSLLTGPCGFDLFSYSYRARTGVLYHDSRPRSPPAIGDLDKFIRGYGPGDVLGVEIYLPKPTEQQKSILDSRVWRPKARSSYEAFKVPLPLPKAGPQSEIRYYVNGQLLGPAFSDLYLGKYHPSFSLFRDAEAKVNFGPSFKYPPSHLVTEADFPLIPIPKLVASAPAPAPAPPAPSPSSSSSTDPSAPAPSGDPTIPPNPLAVHPASYSTTTPSNPSLQPTTNPPSTPSRAPPPPPLTLLAPEPDRPESASQRHQAWDLMHADGRVFPYYRVRDITPGKHYVDKSGSRVSTKVQVASPTSPFRSATATAMAGKSVGDAKSPVMTAAAGPDQAVVADDEGTPLSPMSPIGASKRRRTMGGGIMSPTLGGGGGLALALGVGEMAALVLPPVSPVQAGHEPAPGHGFTQGVHGANCGRGVDEDVEMPDADSAVKGANQRGDGDGPFGDSPLA